LVLRSLAPGTYPPRSPARLHVASLRTHEQGAANAASVRHRCAPFYVGVAAARCDDPVIEFEGGFHESGLAEVCLICLNASINAAPAHGPTIDPPPERVAERFGIVSWYKQRILFMRDGGCWADGVRHHQRSRGCPSLNHDITEGFDARRKRHHVADLQQAW